MYQLATMFLKSHNSSSKSFSSVLSMINKVDNKAPSDDKLKMYVYLEHENGSKVKEYGKQIGKAAGGNSRIVNEALREFFKKHNL